jgi:hypothetical protein
MRPMVAPVSCRILAAARSQVWLIQQGGSGKTWAKYLCCRATDSTPATDCAIEYNRQLIRRNSVTACLLGTLCIPLVVAGVPEFEPNFGQAAAQSRYLARRIEIGAGGPIGLRWTQSGGPEQGSWVVGEPTGNSVNYCNQGNIKLCREAIRTYGRLTRRNLYPGIDWMLHGQLQSSNPAVVRVPAVPVEFGPGEN